MSKILDCFLDTMIILKDNAAYARNNSIKDEVDLFKRGISFGYYEVLHLIEQQAKSFDLELKDLGLEDFDPDRDLLGLEKAKDNIEARKAGKIS